MSEPTLSPADQLGLEIMQKSAELAKLRAQDAPVPVDDYVFNTMSGETTLSALFADRDRLLVIHNMGQGCRYCTVYADGVNGVLHHLENAMSVVLVSKDDPDVQRRMANDRGWRMRLASHGGGAYMDAQCSMAGYKNYPGAAVYKKEGGRIFRIGRTAFGPGDLFSPVWPFLGLAGMGEEDWTPQFTYWARPEKLDDGGENVND